MQIQSSVQDSRVVGTRLREGLQTIWANNPKFIPETVVGFALSLISDFGLMCLIVDDLKIGQEDLESLFRKYRKEDPKNLFDEDQDLFYEKLQEIYLGDSGIRDLFAEDLLNLSRGPQTVSSFYRFFFDLLSLKTKRDEVLTMFRGSHKTYQVSMNREENYLYLVCMDLWRENVQDCFTADVFWSKTIMVNSWENLDDNVREIARRIETSESLFEELNSLGD